MNKVPNSIKEEPEEANELIQFRQNKKYNEMFKLVQPIIGHDQMAYHAADQFGRTELFDKLMTHAVPGYNVQYLKLYLNTTVSYKQLGDSIESRIRVVDVKGVKDKFYKVSVGKTTLGLFNSPSSTAFEDKLPTCMHALIPLMIMIREEDCLEEFIGVTEDDYEEVMSNIEHNNEVVFDINLKLMKFYSNTLTGNFAEFDKVLKCVYAFTKDCSNMGKNIDDELHDFLLAVADPKLLVQIKGLSPKTKFKLLFEMCDDAEFLLTPALVALRNNL